MKECGDKPFAKIEIEKPMDDWPPCKVCGKPAGTTVMLGDAEGDSFCDEHLREGRHGKGGA